MGQHHGSHEEELNIPTSPQRGRPRQRQPRPPLTAQRQVLGSPLPSPTPSRSNSREPLYRTTSLETRSRTPSPENIPTPTPIHEYYGSANLTDRSRSPSPSSTAETSRSKRTGRRLPATPQKPSTLNLKSTNTLPNPQQNMPHVIPSPTIPQPHKSPGSINFPRLSASPTHRPNIPAQQQRGPPPSVGRGMRAFSPTETNDLNMPGGRGQLPRQSSRDRMPPDQDRPPRYPGQILNNSRPEPVYTDSERDNRFRDNRFEAEVTTGLPGRPLGRPAPIVPNGYKPGQGRRPQRTAMGRPSPAIITAQGAASDSDDDEDWC